MKIKDPIHSLIYIEEEFMKYFSNKFFLRLRNIKQTSFLDFVYPSANHTRFSHSIGCFNLMKKFINNEKNKINPTNKKRMLIAALLHDIGHGPFSHSFEKIFPKFNHEIMTKKILEEEFNLKEISKILSKENPYSLLLSSIIDADKLDYMARDSYFCGINSSSDFDYLISNCYVENEKLIINKNSILAVEDLLSKRITNYKILYFHRSSLLKEFIFEKIFQRINFLLKNKKKVYMEENFKNFLSDFYNLKFFYNVCDFTILTHLNKWLYSDDKILKNLCQNYFEIKKDFSIINLKTNKVNINILKSEIEKKYDLNYYFSHVKKNIKIIENQLYVKIDEYRIRKIEDMSPLIKFFRDNNFEVEYLFFPKKIIPKDLESLDIYFNRN